MTNLKRALDVGFAWGMYQHLNEITNLGKLLEEANTRKVIEIGAHRGGTTAFFATLCPDLVLSIDLPDGHWGGIGVPASAERNRQLVELWPHIVPVVADSQDPHTVHRVQTMLKGDKVDFLFIDGDHSRAGVTADFENYSRFVREGGMIAFHDISYCERHTKDKVQVPEFWHELAANGPYHTRVFEDNLGWGGIGVLFV
jgi:cephalosporin hydroxylase